MLKLISFPVVLILAGGALTLVGGFLATVENNKEKVQSIEREKKYTDELRAKSEEIARISIYNLNMVTGGDSFPFIDPTFNIATPHSMVLWLGNGGKYPLYDVTVTITDLVKLKE